MIFNKLKNEMTKQNISQSKVANKIGIGRVSLNYKLNGKTQFTLNEILIILETLNIDFNEYFKGE